jgi:hypothetical protein
MSNYVTVFILLKLSLYPLRCTVPSSCTVPSTLYCALYTVLCPLRCTVPFTLCCVIYAVLCPLRCTVPFTIYCTLYVLYYALYAVLRSAAPQSLLVLSAVIGGTVQ